MRAPTPREASAPALRLARWVSIVAHPFATALALVVALEAHRGWPAAARSLAAVAVLFVLPLALLMASQVRRGAWQTVDASRPRERPILFVVGGAGLLALLGYFAVARPGSLFVHGAIGVLGMVALCAVATRWVKVSLHVAAAALAAAALLGRGLAAGWLFALVVPPLGWSRVALGRHRWIEVALGTVIGAAAGALTAASAPAGSSGTRDPGTERAAEATAAADSSARAVTAPWYRRTRALDLTDDGQADSARLEAVGERLDSLRITLVLFVGTAVTHREAWSSSYELALADSSLRGRPETGALLRARLDSVLSSVRVQRLDAPGVRLMAEDSAILAGIEPRPTHRVSFSYGYETMVRLAWDARRRRFIRLWSCC